MSIFSKLGSTWITKIFSNLTPNPEPGVGQNLNLDFDPNYLFYTECMSMILTYEFRLLGLDQEKDPDSVDPSQTYILSHFMKSHFGSIFFKIQFPLCPWSIHPW